MPAPIPVHLICGFLGAGKTTLMRRILQEQPATERLVIIINEYGELGIDGRLLSGFDSEVRELTTGCICCTLQSDLVYTLFDLYEKFQPDRILVEASGVAEVNGMEKAVRRVGLTTPVQLGSVTTVVDVEMFLRREILGRSFFNPIEKADLILLNKVDRVPEQDVPFHHRALKEINAGARIVPVIQCAVERDVFLTPGKTKLPMVDHGEHHHHEATDDFVAFFFESESCLDSKALLDWFASLPWRLFRIKGFVQRDDGDFFLNYTYQHPEFTPLEEKIENTKLAFVGWQVDPEEFLIGLRACCVE